MMSAESKHALLTHSLSRRGQLHVEAALQVLDAVQLSSTRWRQDVTAKATLHFLLQSAAESLDEKGRREARTIALRCCYTEITADPRLGIREPDMLAAVEKWEANLWRMPGHVQLVVTRARESVQRELDRRARAKAGALVRERLRDRKR